MGQFSVKILAQEGQFSVALNNYTTGAWGPPDRRIGPLTG